MDRAASHLYAGGSDGHIHVASLSFAANTSIAPTSSWHASGNTTAALIGVGMANGSKNLIGGGAVTNMLVIKKSAAGDMVRACDGGEGLTVCNGEAWRKADEVAWMEQTLRESEVDKAS
ncbi:hypothetical protein E2562_034142 [Oryza meyeriana var. granulata]|uniref:Uncharacterized protein n=1 Tax=Oryza meyeriana var. granulata TaxID=110450 RepID=A0A6G1DS16_9ORYZ|nr:hypothetical protein E2562_034142 [Oryza meyeriana var. granulata]